MPTRVAWFFVVALGFTWLLQAPAVLAKLGMISGGEARFGGLAALGAFGPLVGAVVMSYVEGRWSGVRELFRPSALRRSGWRWLPVALVLFVVVNVAGALVARALGWNEVRWVYLPENAQHVAGLVMMPLLEEPGWRGYAQPRLVARLGVLRASFVVGVLWAAWHTTMWLMAGLDAAAFALAAAVVFLGSVPFGWLHRRSQGSLLVVVVAHVGAHVDNPFRAHPGSLAPLAVEAGALAVTSALLVVTDREVFRAP
ncbi:MAG: CPBP family intramembrane metalloprotease [Deltaproteobacteria bacterium]|nr:CPBP family intramembrane metalloprotease [Deltaproteobacteria bacterium]